MKNSIKIGALAMAIAGAGLCMVGCGQEGATIKNMDISGNFQTEYLVGEQLYLDDAKLVLTYSDGEQKTIDVTASMIENFNTTSAGDKSLKINYNGESIDVDYKVVASDFDYVYSNIRTNFLATKYIEVVHMRHGDSDILQGWTNYDKYVRNDNLLYEYDFVEENYVLYNFGLHKKHDGNNITDYNEDIANAYGYACTFLEDTTLSGASIFNKQVKIEDHKYAISYTMTNGENNINCKIVASFDLKIESCEATQANTGDASRILYSYTNVQTLTWPNA